MNTTTNNNNNDNNNQNAGNSLSLSLSLSLSEEQEREKASKSFFLYAREVISFSLFLSFSAGVVQLLFRVTEETLN